MSDIKNLEASGKCAFSAPVVEVRKAAGKLARDYMMTMRQRPTAEAARNNRNQRRAGTWPTDGIQATGRTLETESAALEVLLEGRRPSQGT